ncbi:hypothetical protein [Herbidospora daliensis]|uniref:hypothetical protein n=1 Tax=Herbidospora daliensis TaxID=295585 RepID=UPI000783BAB9|nr:hypothetical protein [Herbidospora daliensis]
MVRYGLGALFASAVALAAWVYGVWAGAFLEMRPTGEYCTGGPLGFPATSWTWLPLSHECHYADGAVQELVPAPVNLVVDGCLLVVLACAVAALRVRAASAGSRPSPAPGVSPGR